MNETNSNTTKLGHVVGIGVCRECDAESRVHFPNRAYADLWLHRKGVKNEKTMVKEVEGKVTPPLRPTSHFPGA